MFENKNLSVMAFANGFTLWHYKDTSLLYSDLNPAGFFNRIYNLCAVGDKFMVNTRDCYVEYVVVRLENRKVFCKELCKLELTRTQDEEDI